MKFSHRLYRQQEIRKLRDGLERDSFPRMQMFLLVALTGTSGFIVSYFLLHAGFDKMWLRYLLSIAAAYLMFLIFLWLWLRSSAHDYTDFSDLPVPSSSPFGNSSSSACFGDNGGNFAGGGASSSFDSPPAGFSGLGDTGGSVGDVLGGAADAEELAIPLFLLIAIGAMLFSVFFLVSSAPMLLAELLVDGVLSASLYRRLRGLETRHWLETALRRTLRPFALTTVLVVASGWGMAIYAPEAHTIGDVIFHLRHGK